MAKKEETPNLVACFAEFKELKNIDKITMINVLEESFRNVLAKMFGTDVNLDVILNPDKGDVQIFQNLEVVEDGTVTDPNLQIGLTDAKADQDPDAEIGDEHTREIFFADFGRRAILNLRQTLQSKILDLQKEAIYDKFKELEGELVTGEVYQTWARETLLLDDDKNELLLPKSESIPGDFFRKGETVRAVVANVDNKNNNPKITVSRTNAVEGYDERIDPVGACVGVKGSRIHGIVRELRNENIDVINYTSNPSLFIQRALSPARVSTIRIDEDEKKAEVFLRPEEVSLAIGKQGLNIKLASMLTGYVIDVYRESDEVQEEDIYLDEFKDEIDPWVIETLKNMGLVTAKNVLAMPRQEIIDKADLEESTVDQLLQVLRAEFEDAPEGDAEPDAQA